ncbi:MAG: hypothetical protein R3C11_21840 [Planctomycetaceae bacterium]
MTTHYKIIKGKQQVTEVDASSTEEPRILILSGPSGSGKTTIVKKLMERQPVPLVKSISATTRPPRAHEEDQWITIFLTGIPLKRN